MRLVMSSTAAFVVCVVACTGGGDLDGASSSGSSTSSSTSSSGSTSGGSTSSTSSSTSSSGSSGFITDGGPGNCGGPVAFQLTVSGDASFCTGQGSCSAEWLTVQRADKTPVQIDTSCVAACGACEPVGCPGNCPQPSPVPKTGATKTWLNGRIFTDKKCNSKAGGGSIPCSEPACAPAGKYIAHMCAFRAGDAGAGNGCSAEAATPAQICTDVEFDFPTTSPVKGTVGP